MATKGNTQPEEDWSRRKKCGKEALNHGHCLGMNKTNHAKCKAELDRLYYCCLKIWETQKRVPYTCPEIEHNPLYQDETK